jgi:hypothetical protein
MAARQEAQGYLTGTGASHRSHGCCFTDLGRLWRHGRAEAVGVPAVQPAHLHALLPRRETGVSLTIANDAPHKSFVSVDLEGNVIAATKAEIASR